MSVLSDVATVLAAASLGIYDPVGATSTIYTHSMPPGPFAAMSVRLYGHAPDGPYLFDDTMPLYEQPRIQIMVRDPDADTALSRCNTAWKTLIGLTDIALGGVHYFSIRSVTGPIELQQDDNNNWLYVCNLQCMKGFS